MPSRNNTKTIKTPELQGDDSYVVVRSLTVGEAKVLRKDVAELTKRNNIFIAEYEAEHNITLTEDEKNEILATHSMDQDVNRLMSVFLANNIVRWNWVDDNGEPLPQPQDNPDVFDLLTTDEYAFITSVFSVKDSAEKN